MAGRGLAARVRRARPGPGGAAGLRQRGGPRRCAAARGDAADGRPGAAGPRDRQPEGALPAADPGRRGAFRHRVHRAGGGHRPGVAAHQGGPGRGHLSGERGEDLHHRRPRRRLHLAGLPHRSGRAPPQGHLHPHRGHLRPGVLLDPDHHPRRRAPHQRDLLLRRAGAGHDAGRGGERRLAAGDGAAQPRAGDAGPGGPDRRPVRAGVRLGGAGRAAGPARRPPGAGADLRQPAHQRAAQLAGGGGAHAGDRGRVDHEGLRLRAAAARLRAARGDRRAPRRPGRLRDRGAVPLARYSGQTEYGADLRRWCQRDPARAHRDGWPRPAPGAAMTGGVMPADGGEAATGAGVAAGAEAAIGEAAITEAAARIAALGESSPRAAPDVVNLPMIRHWVQAMDDTNPVYTDARDAARSVHGGLVAPPAMTQVWTMRGLRPAGGEDSGDPLGLMSAALDEAGFTSVVATNSEQEYYRYLRLGEQVTVRSTLEDVSGPKRTALGEGWFVTTRSIWYVGTEAVASMMFRILKFRPSEPSARPEPPGAA